MDKRKSDNILFFAQISLIIIVVIASITNISLENGNLTLWTSLLSSCLGYVLPNPKITIEKPKEENNE